MLSRMVFAKYFSLPDVAVIPEWTPFYKTLSFKLIFPTIIENCRSYPASPTSMTNVYISKAVYQICKEIQWKTKKRICPHVIPFGRFPRSEKFPWRYWKTNERQRV